MKRAILYVRNSDPDYVLNRGRESARARILGDAETTIEQQIEEGTELITSLGATLAPEDIRVEFMTGVDSLFERPVISRIRDEIRDSVDTARHVSLLVCYDTDRLARDPIDTGLVLKECMRHGCELQFVRMPLENSEVGMILLFMRGYGDRLEAKKFQDRVRRHREACKRAKKIHAANTAPYGYYNDFRFDEVVGKKIFTGTRAVDKEAAKVLRRMAELIAYDGYTATQVALLLQREHVPCPAAHRGYRYRSTSASSCQWNSSKVCKLMRDPTYTGKTFINQYRLTGKKNARGKQMQEKLPVSEWELLTDDPAVTPAIIPQELFDAVQERLDANREGEHTTRNNRRPVLLRGRVFCAECGRKMYATVSHKEKGVYRCSSSHLKGGVPCPGTSVPRAELEARAWQAVARILSAPEIVEREIAAALEGSGARQLEEDLRFAEAEVKSRRAYLDDIVGRMMQAARAGRKLVADRLEAETVEVEAEIVRLEKHAAGLRQSLGAKGRAEEMSRRMDALCAAFREGLKGDIPFERKCEALTALRATIYASSKREPMMRARLAAVLPPAMHDRTQNGFVAEPRRATVGRASRPRL
jgi:site-specific DNA recombinase